MSSPDWKALIAFYKMCVVEHQPDPSLDNCEIAQIVAQKILQA